MQRAAGERRTVSPDMRIAIGIEYDGTAYNGWQRQRTGLGVQQVLEQALGEVADETIEITCAGRDRKSVV